MDESEQLRAARAMRRAILGDANVDGMTAEPDLLAVLETSSGQSAATSDKFQKHVLTGCYASGFTNSLMAKDVRLYLEEAVERGAVTSIGRVAAAVWEQFAAREPGADFTRIYPFVAGGKWDPNHHYSESPTMKGGVDDGRE
jgi:hypothetical protein